tara:strand:+ start:3464 stop:4357 length:894 start_codon:yes stop_codon:yes gene_type:complete
MVDTVRTEQLQVLPEYQETFLKDLLASTSTLANRPTTIPEYQVAGLTPAQQQAIQLGVSGVGAYQPMMQAGATTLGQGVAALQPGAFQQYMSPFTDQVIDQSLADLQRQADMERQRIGSAAVQAGAFGGSRQAIAEQELQRNTADAFARQSAQLRAQAFESAQDRAQQGAELFGKLGLQQAAMGESAQAAQARDVGILSQLGGQEQAQQQAELEAQRATSLERQFEPYQRIGFMSDIFRGVPTTTSTLTSRTAPSPSTLSQIAGLGMGVAGLQQAGAFGEGGIFGGLGSFLGMGGQK